jgi:YD repeat-containing protein
MRTWGHLLVVALSIAMWTASDAIAQVPFVADTTSTPVPASGHDYLADLSEVVNPADGSLSIRIAAPPQKERGVGMPHYVFVYDSNVGSPVPSAGTVNDKPNTLIGIALSRQNGELIKQSAGIYGWPNSITSAEEIYPYSNTPGGCPGVNCDNIHYRQNFVYTDPQGGRHDLDLRWDALPENTQGEVGLLASPGGRPEVLVGGDQQYHATLNDTTGVVTVVDNHGTVLLPNFEDSNGNGPDGTGRTYSTVTGSGADAGNVVQVTVPGVTGSYTISWAATAATFTVPFDGGPCGTRSAAYTPNSLDRAPQSVILPDGRKYVFGYDPTYGLINSITYPNGVVVQYQWTMQPKMQNIAFTAGCFDSNNSNLYYPQSSFAYGWPAITSRTVSLDGGATPVLEQDFHYGNNMAYSSFWSWTQKTTSVETIDKARDGAPVASWVYYTYSPASYVATRTNNDGLWYGLPATPQEIEIQTKDGANNVVKTEYKSWNAFNQLSGDCVAVTGTGTVGVFYSYQPGPTINGQTSIYPTDLVTDKKEYALSSATPCQQPGSSTTPTRETVTTYQTFAATPIFPGGPSILDRPQSVKIYDNGSLEAQTDYSYDEYAAASVPSSLPLIDHDQCYLAVGAPSGCPASSSVPRGNATSVTRHCFINCADVTTHNWYDETGQLIKSLDGKQQNYTTYSYLDNFDPTYGGPSSGQTNTYLTGETLPTTNGVAHTLGWAYAYYNGQIAESIDQNKNQTKYCYLSGGCSGEFEPWGRLKEVDEPQSLGRTTISYSDDGYTPTVTTTTDILATPAVQKAVTSTMDGLGRTFLTNVQDGTSTGINVSTTYDGLSRIYQKSNPYNSTSDPTYGQYTYTYDPLSRIIQIDNPDISPHTFNTTIYSGNGATYTDEDGHKWTRTYDAFGRLAQVLEPNSANVPTFATTYTYDALNDLKTVTQNGDTNSGSTPHIRQFSYTGLAQLHTATNPESGTTSYSYDLNGNLYQKVDANGVTVTYGYDGLNRLISKSFAGGNATPAAGYDYDTGPSGGNFIGRLVDEYTGSQASPRTKRVIQGYDANGRILGEQQCFGTCTSSSPTVSYGYNLAGDIGSTGVSAGGSPVTTVTSKYDTADRIASVSTSYSGNPSAPTTFDATHPDKLFSAESSTAYSALGLANPQYGILTSNGVNGQPAASGIIAYDKRSRVTSATYSGK